MSANLLDVELERRVLEVLRENDELELARRIRLELLQPLPPPVPVIFPLRDARTDFDEAAAAVLVWWEQCKAQGPGQKRQYFVTNAKVDALARRIRGLSRGRT